MLPTVTDLTLQRLKKRLWRHWFGDKVPSPFQPLPSIEEAPALLKRSLHRRLLRAKWASTVLWLLALPGLYLLSRLTRLEAARRQSLQQKAARLTKGCTVAIGNLIVGGTGKTPLVICLAKALSQQGHKVAVLSRGYKRKVSNKLTQSALVIGPDCRDPTTGELLHPELTGDEPWLIALRARVPVAVGQDRYLAAQQLAKHFPQTTIWLLDDGLSQTSLCPDFRLLLLDDRGLGNGHCLPYGPLRMEWTRELAKAWCKPSHPIEAQAQASPLLLGHPEGQPFKELFEGQGLTSPSRFATRRFPGCWVRLTVQRNHFGTDPNHEAAEGPLGLHEERLSLEEGCLRFKATERPVLAVAGIAKPYAFFEGLKDLNLPIQKTLELSNHHPQPMQAVRAWLDEEKVSKHCIVLTTEKDAVKLAWQAPEPNDSEVVIEWWALQLELSVEPSPLEFLNGCKTT